MKDMHPTHILTQQLLESFHKRLCRLEFQYLSGIEHKRGREKDETELLTALKTDFDRGYPDLSRRPYDLLQVVNSFICMQLWKKF